MKIQFEIDIEEKKIIFFLNKEEFKKDVREMLKRQENPEKLSKSYTYILAKAMQEISTITKLNLEEYRPEIIEI